MGKLRAEEVCEQGTRLDDRHAAEMVEQVSSSVSGHSGHVLWLIDGSQSHERVMGLIFRARQSFRMWQAQA
jgi:hypothetical protein